MQLRVAKHREEEFVALQQDSMLSCHIIMQPAQINSDKIIILYCILTLY